MRALRFLFSLHGRAGRSAMAGISVVFILLGLIHGQVMAQGATRLAAGVAGLQLLLLWPAQLAIPTRRFHDMGRSARWIAVFWGGAVISMLFTYWGVQETARVLDMSFPQVWSDPDGFVAAIDAFNAANPDLKPLKTLNGSGMGGISLAMIFLIIQFGWLHLIPGQTEANRFGAPLNKR